MIEQSAELVSAVLTVSLSGTSSAAGFAVGADDFLVPVDSAGGERRLQLEIDGNVCSFRVDGVWRETREVAQRETVMLKGDVAFRDLTVTPLQSPPRVSVIMTCYRFAQRLRVALASWCRQRVPAGALEVIVVNPESPDATHEVVASMAGTYPEVRLREIAVADAMSRNKGWMLNRGIDVSRGEWIWLTDADCVFPPDAASRLLAANPSPLSLLFGERRHLSRKPVDALLASRLDPAGDYDALLASATGDGGWVDAHPWGYTQIVHGSQRGRVRYREDLDQFNRSDGHFIDVCRTAGLRETRLDGLTCLHLVHPFAWYGTGLFL